MSDQERIARLKPFGVTWLLLPSKATTKFPCPLQECCRRGFRMEPAVRATASRGHSFWLCDWPLRPFTRFIDPGDSLRLVRRGRWWTRRSACRESAGRLADLRASCRTARRFRRCPRGFGDGIDVGEVHGHGTVDLLAEFEGWSRRGRREDGVYFVKRGEEIVGQQAPYLLRFFVVGVVVARTEDVGSEHDAALDLGAESALARSAVHG